MQGRLHTSASALKHSVIMKKFHFELSKAFNHNQLTQTLAAFDRQESFFEIDITLRRTHLRRHKEGEGILGL